jgi:hypothetical protein
MHGPSAGSNQSERAKNTPMLEKITKVIRNMFDA